MQHGQPDSEQKAARRVRIMMFVLVPLGVLGVAAVDYGLGGWGAALTTLGLGVLAWAWSAWVVVRRPR
jgi:hypothetical protein